MTCSSKTDLPAKTTTRHRFKRAVRRLRRQEHYAAVELRILGVVVWLALLLLRRTTRFECQGTAPLEDAWRRGQPVVFAFWHGRAIMLPFSYQGPKATIMNSTHRDGEVITRALRRFGFGTARGSSRRGAVSATLALLRALRDGSDVALIPDGPRGPAGVARAGAVELAAVAGAPLFPMAFSASRCVRLRTWDRMMIPLPASRVVCIVGEPFLVEASERPRRAERETLRLELERRLRKVTRAADRAVGRPEEDW